MKNKGFTLVELLVVLVIMAIISAIGFAGVTAVQKNIKKNLWEAKIELIISGAKNYGEDNKNKLKETNICNVNGEEKEYCITKTVQFLLDNNYIKTDEEDNDGKAIITNDTLDEDDTNYIVNNKEVKIYLEDNTIYATMD